MDVKEIRLEGMHCIHLAYNRDYRLIFVNTVINFWIPYIRFSPNDEHLVYSASSDGTVKLWDLRLGNQSVKEFKGTCFYFMYGSCISNLFVFILFVIFSEP
jgi:WD40 repeat protein